MGMKTVLTADIGGTKTILAVVHKGETGIELVSLTKYESRKFASFDDILDLFLAEHPSVKFESICVAVAGAVIGNRCSLTKLNMTVAGDDLARKYGIGRVSIINDLEASGYGLEMIPNSALERVQGEAAGGNRVLISPGTGLGESIINFIEGRYIPLPSEGGHADFAPFNGVTGRLWLFLKRTQTRVAVEDVLSGPGINNIYKFQASENGVDLSDEIRNELAAKPGATVAQLAVDQKDPLAIQTVSLFWDILAAESGNMALKALPHGGVYLGGGIVPKLIQFLDKKKFGSILAAKGIHRPILEKLPVFAITDTTLPLYGAANYMMSSRFV